MNHISKIYNKLLSQEDQNKIKEFQKTLKNVILGNLSWIY